MKTSKTAFTMIELIFVIVILGILAAVAIPKLAATRDDAIVSALGMSIGTTVSEIVEYSVSNGVSTNDITLMSNGAATLVRTGKATKSNGGRKITVKVPSGLDCINMEVITTATNDDLNVSYITQTDAVCLALQSIVDRVEYSVQIRGISVVQ